VNYGLAHNNLASRRKPAPALESRWSGGLEVQFVSVVGRMSDGFEMRRSSSGKEILACRAFFSLPPGKGGYDAADTFGLFYLNYLNLATVGARSTPPSQSARRMGDAARYRFVQGKNPRPPGALFVPRDQKTASSAGQTASSSPSL
jgi:hypothetical protein